MPATVAACFAGCPPLGARSPEAPRTARLSWVLRLHYSPKGASLLHRQIIRFVLGKGEQHQKLAPWRMPEVGDPCTAALPPPAHRPAEFAQTPGATNDLAGVRSSNESELQESVLLGTEQIVDPAGEDPRLDDDHRQNIRQWRMLGKCLPSEGGAVVNDRAMSRQRPDVRFEHQRPSRPAPLPG